MTFAAARASRANRRDINESAAISWVGTFTATARSSPSWWPRYTVANEPPPSTASITN